MINRWWYAAVLLLAACGGAAPGHVEPANSPSTAVQAFMRAVADSNVTAMAGLWGTERGAAGKTRQPSDYERRIVIMQAYLNHDDSRILSDTPDPTGTRHALQVQLRRQACTWTIPFTVIKLADGSWIINQIDLTAAGNPARACDPSGQDTSTAR